MRLTHARLARAFQGLWKDERRRKTLARIIVHERQFENWWKFEVATQLWKLAEQLGVLVWIEADRRADILLAHARPQPPQRFDPSRAPRVPIELKTVGTFWKNAAKAFAESKKKRLAQDMDDALSRRISGRADPFAAVGLLVTHRGGKNDETWRSFLEYPTKLAAERGLLEVLNQAVPVRQRLEEQEVWAQQMVWVTP